MRRAEYRERERERNREFGEVESDVEHGPDIGSVDDTVQSRKQDNYMGKGGQEVRSAVEQITECDESKLLMDVNDQDGKHPPTSENRRKYSEQQEITEVTG